jgi:hypothetical protein
VNYLNPTFSVTMPGGKAPWPFDEERKRDMAIEETHWYEKCNVCGAAVVVSGRRFKPAHEDPRDAGRPRQRICFWR